MRHLPIDCNMPTFRIRVMGTVLYYKKKILPLWRGWPPKEAENTRDQMGVLTTASRSWQMQWEAQTLYLQCQESAYFARLCQGLRGKERTIGTELAWHLVSRGCFYCLKQTRTMKRWRNVTCIIVLKEQMHWGAGGGLSD